MHKTDQKTEIKWHIYTVFREASQPTSVILNMQSDYSSNFFDTMATKPTVKAATDDVKLLPMFRHCLE